MLKCPKHCRNPSIAVMVAMRFFCKRAALSGVPLPNVRVFDNGPKAIHRAVHSHSAFMEKACKSKLGRNAEKPELCFCEPLCSRATCRGDQQPSNALNTGVKEIRIPKYKSPEHLQDYAQQMSILKSHVLRFASRLSRDRRSSLGEPSKISVTCQVLKVHHPTLCPTQTYA